MPVTSQHISPHRRRDGRAVLLFPFDARAHHTRRSPASSLRRALPHDRWRSPRDRSPRTGGSRSGSAGRWSRGRGRRWVTPHSHGRAIAGSRGRGPDVAPGEHFPGGKEQLLPRPARSSLSCLLKDRFVPRVLLGGELKRDGHRDLYLHSLWNSPGRETGLGARRAVYLAPAEPTGFPPATRSSPCPGARRRTRAAPCVAATRRSSSRRPVVRA